MSTPPLDPVERQRQKIAALRAKLDNEEAALKAQTRADETARKVEAGALAINHMRENPGTEFATIMHRLLNDNVPDFRRRLFTEFSISPKPPKGSNAEKRSTKTKAANEDGKPALKKEFKK